MVAIADAPAEDDTDEAEDRAVAPFRPENGEESDIAEERGKLNIEEEEEEEGSSVRQRRASHARIAGTSTHRRSIASVMLARSFA